MAGQENNPSGLMTLFCHPVATFLAALRFLTILPLPWGAARDGRYFTSSIYWFPAIGLLLGLLTAAAALLLARVLPLTVVAPLAMVIPVVLSGALHLDGLADSGDGLLSARPRDQALEIMRDSRIGAMGVISLILVLLLRFAALASLSQPLLLSALVIMPLAGRCAIVLAMALLPYAREGEGLGRLFYSPASRLAAGWSGLVLLAAAATLAPEQSLLLVLFLAAWVGLFSLWCRSRLGGATGDTLGATSELTETAAALFFAALASL